jgi:capsular exopolysaccharide synthesis family protein
MLRRRKWVVVLCLVATFLPAVLLLKILPPQYEAVATIIYEEPRDTMIALDVGQAFYNKSGLINLTELLKSRSLAIETAQALPEQIVQTFKFPNPFAPNFSRAKYIAGRLQANLTIQPVRGSDIIKISMQANDPVVAQVIANTYVERIIDWNLRKKRAEISNVREFVEKQLKVFQDKLNIAEEALQEFKEQNKMISLSEASAEMLKRLTQTETTYDQVKADREALEQRQRSIELKKRELAPSLTITSSPLARQLKQQLIDLEMQYSSHQVNGYSANEKELANLKQRIEQVKEELVQELLQTAQQGNLFDPLSQIRRLLQESVTLEVQLETTRTRERALKKSIADYEAQLTRLPKQEMMLARLIRTRDVDEKIYSMLRQRHEEIGIAEAGKIGDVHVIDSATKPVSPIKPDKKKFLAGGFFLGLALGISLALLLELLDVSLKSQEDVEKYTMLPVLAVIPTIPIHGTNGALRFKNKNSVRSYSERLLSTLDWNPLIYEAFRSFQINFAFVNADRLFKSILLTSAGMGEGKTLTSLNLTQAFARAGLRTLLIDCDLRRPMVHRILGINGEPGLTNVLINKVEPEQAVLKLESENCFILPCGTLPPNPSEILDSRKMRELLAKLKNEYDLVILDSPPLIAVTDSIVLSNEVDGVCLVIKSGRTSRDAVSKAKRLLENARARVIGAILNDINLKKMHAHYQDYYSYYAKSKKGSKRNTMKKEKRKTSDHAKSLA